MTDGSLKMSRTREPLARHTVFRIGGPADVWVEPSSADELVTAVREAVERARPWVILGAGSNVLVADRGFRGTVIHPVGGSVRIRGTTVEADAAVAMAYVAAESLRCGLTGFEWAIGVPGSIGGSVRGNAGCFGREMKDVLERVRVCDAIRGALIELSNAECEFAYRQSLFKRRPELVVVSAALALHPGDPAIGRERLKEFTRHRAETQDIGSQSAGCIFKNVPWDRRGQDRERLADRFPELAPFVQKPNIPVGFLIDQVGLKGRRVGGAMISSRHGNFIVNTGQATAEEVLTLICIAKEYVHRHYGFLLEEEIQYVGFEDFIVV